MAFPPNNQIRIREGKVTPITVPDDKLEYLNSILLSDNLEKVLNILLPHPLKSLIFYCDDV
jgi:hypothetical protein